MGHWLPLIPPWRHPRTSTNSFRKPRNNSCGTVVAPTSTGIPPQGCISWSCEEQAGMTVSKTVGKILEGPISTCTYLPQKGHKSEQPVIMSMFITPWRFSNLCFWWAAELAQETSCPPGDRLQQYLGLIGRLVITLNSSGSNLISQLDGFMPELTKNPKQTTMSWQMKSW